MPEWFPWSTDAPCISPSAVSCRKPGGSTVPPWSGRWAPASVVHGRLVAGVRLRLQLERAVLEFEVATEARAERVQHAAAVPVGQRRIGDDDVRRQHREAGGDGPRVEVVDTDDAVDAEDVRAHVVQVDVLGGGLEQHVECLTQQVPGAGQYEDTDEQRRKGVGGLPAG